MIDLFSASFTIHSFQADSNQQAKASALFGFFMETAGWHANRLGVGYTRLKSQHNAFWALSRFNLNIITPVKWEDTVLIETWPAGYNRLFAHRCFRFKNSENNILADGATDWVVMRYDDRTMIPPAQIVGQLNYDNSTLIVDAKTKKLAVNDQNTTEKTSRNVLYSDLDMNQHVNSLKYLDWVMDCLDISFYQKHQLKCIDINFQHEVIAGSEVFIYHKKTRENTFLFNGAINDNGKPAFSIQLGFNEL